MNVLSEVEEMLRRQPRRLTPEQVAMLLKVTTRTLRSWRLKGYGPVHVRAGKKFIKYEEAAVLEWLAQQRSLRDHSQCPTCGARIFHEVCVESQGGRDESL